MVCVFPFLELAHWPKAHCFGDEEEVSCLVAAGTVAENSISPLVLYVASKACVRVPEKVHQPMIAKEVEAWVGVVGCFDETLVERGSGEVEGVFDTFHGRV